MRVQRGFEVYVRGLTGTREVNQRVHTECECVRDDESFQRKEDLGNTVNHRRDRSLQDTVKLGNDV